MNNTTNQYFRWKCFKGLKEKGFASNPNYIKQLNYEIDIIIQMGFPDYFLLVQDILSWARDNKILTGPGRGSSVGALVTYVLGITHIDPIKYKLVFERFLNPERISMPDIDLDISETQRDDLIQYIKTTYGSECVANIGTFGTMKAKGAIRDITRTLGYDYEIGDNLARLVLEPVAGKVQDLNICYEKVPELQKARINNGPEQEILTWAEKFENRIRSSGVHASGLLIADTPVYERIPLCKSKDNSVATQFEMNTVEKCGLVKFDFLGLRTLTIISKCIALVKERHNTIIDIYNLPEDENVFLTLAAGETNGIFQMDAGQGLKELVIKAPPHSISDISDLISLFRPGPISNGMLADYIAIRNQQKKPEYLIPELIPILESTYGLCVYQEQCCVEDSPIWTKDSVKKIQDIQIGDKVITSNGYDIVTNWVNTGEKESVKITTSMGQLSVSKDHPVLCYDDISKTNVFKKAKEIIKTDLIKITDLYKQKIFNSYTECTDSKEELLEAYFIGLLIGDGCLSSSTTICCDTYEIAKFFEEKLKCFYDKSHIYFNVRAWYLSLSCKMGTSIQGVRRTKLTKLLEKYKIFKTTKENKKIHAELFDTIGKKKALLIGLLDSNGGGVEKKNQPTSITQTTKHNLDIIEKFCFDIGIIPKRRENKIYINSLLSLRDIANIIVPLKNFYFSNKLSGLGLVVPKEKAKEFIIKKYNSVRNYSNITKKNRSVFYASKNFICLKTFLPEDVEEIIDFCGLYSNVSKIQDIGFKRVYDLTIENSHEFNISGHIVHNCLEICKQLAGYSLGEADVMRRVIGKKKIDEMTKQKDKFIKGCISNGFDQSIAINLFDMIEKFADYSFNFAHGIAYAYISYITAYLKTYYFLEYMTSCMTCDMDDPDKITKYIESCTSRGIKILPPDINESEVDFAISKDNKNIRFGLGAIKNLGGAKLEKIVQSKQLNIITSFKDFLLHHSNNLNKRQIETLILSGCFDSISNVSRKSLVQNLDEFKNYINEYKKYENKYATYLKKLESYNKREEEIKNGINKKSFIKPIQPKEPELIWHETDKDYTTSEKLNLERELLGYYISGSPFDELPEMKNPNITLLKNLTNLESGNRVCIIGIIAMYKEITTKIKKQKMCFMKIEDKHNTIDAVIMPKKYLELKQLLDNKKPMAFTAFVEIIESQETRIAKLSIIDIKELESIKKHEFVMPSNIKLTIEYEEIPNFIKLISKTKKDSKTDLLVEAVSSSKNIVWQFQNSEFYLDKNTFNMLRKYMKEF